MILMKFQPLALLAMCAFFRCVRHIDEACSTWEQILYDHPTDAFVARLLQNSYYFLGANEAMRDSAARILPEWPKSRPLCGYILGIYSFGLCETRDFDNATVMAHKVLLYVASSNMLASLLRYVGIVRWPCPACMLCLNNA